jgi:drug/metabolite transporter (DMT)-like permease
VVIISIKGGTFLKNPYVLLLFTTLFYSGNLLVGKPVSNEIPPLTLTFFRFILAFIVVLPLGVKEWKNNRDLWKKEWKALLALSLTGLVLFNTLVYLSLNYTTSVNAAIVESSTPIFALLLGFIFFKERFSRIQLFGVVLSLIGVFSVITKGSIEVILNLSFNPGDLTMLLAMIVWAIYSIFVKQHNSKFPIYGGLLVMIVLSFIFLIPMAAFEYEEVTSITWSPSIIIGLLYLGIFPSVIALIAWNTAVNKIGPSQASIFLNFIPVFTMIGAVLFLGEAIKVLQILGALMVISGVMITSSKRAKIEKPNVKAS